jgi:ribosomal protein S19
MFPLFSFIVSSICVYFSYAHTQNYLKHNTLKFSSLSVNKQYYVVKNIIKGVYLAILVILGWFMIIPGILNNSFDNYTIKVFASMYVSNDVVGLYRVSNLPTSTRLHHTASIIFLLVAWTVDFQESNVGQLLLLYTYFSALAFPVNIYLGLRLCYDNMNWLKTISRYVYTIACMVNWIVQIKWYTPATGVYVYMMILTVIIMDDLVLLRWLWK